MLLNITIKRKNLIKYLFCFLFFSQAKCDDLYIKIVNFPEANWHITDIPSFKFQITKTSLNYDLWVIIETDPYYPYQNLYFSYSLAKDTIEEEKKLVECEIFDPLTGVPKGDRVFMSKKHKNKILILSNYKFSSKGEFELRLEQYMRKSTLNGIDSVAIQIKESKL